MQISAFNETLYHRLWGPSEFLCTGSLKRFNAEPILRTIDVPTMFLRGEHDEVMKDTLSSFAQLVPKSQLKTLAGCSHLGYQEEPAAYLQTIRGFLRRLKRTH
ncbi:MAG: hypothetical protein IT290_03425 [Deltaproteobacteria bacterium]|nr:hypothetical protein [Deltaproteobacteria bacterium]